MHYRAILNTKTHNDIYPSGIINQWSFKHPLWKCVQPWGTKVPPPPPVVVLLLASAWANLAGQVSREWKGSLVTSIMTHIATGCPQILILFRKDLDHPQTKWTGSFLQWPQVCVCVHLWDYPFMCVCRQCSFILTDISVFFLYIPLSSPRFILFSLLLQLLSLLLPLLFLSTLSRHPLLSYFSVHLFFQCRFSYCTNSLYILSVSHLLYFRSETPSPSMLVPFLVIVIPFTSSPKHFYWMPHGCFHTFWWIHL